MPLIDTNHQRAALLVLLLGVALVIALTPYATGLIGIPVLYAIFAPVHEWLCMRMRPKLAATVVVLLALFLIVVPGVSFAGLIVNQAQGIAGGVIQSPLLGRLKELRLGGGGLGPRLGGHPGHTRGTGLLRDGAPERGVLGRGDDGVRHPAGGGERPGLGTGGAGVDPR